MTTYVAGRSWIDGWIDTQWVLLVAVGRGGAVTLTRPRIRVISSTKWEVNITRKYHVASSTTILRMLGKLSFGASDLIAKKTINKNARESGVYTSPDGSVEINMAFFKCRRILTHHRRGRSLCRLALWFCAERVNTNDMRQWVCLGTIGLDACNRNEAHGRSG